jgi:hypothetical protein
MIRDMAGRENLTIVMDKSEEIAIDSKKVVVLTRPQVETYNANSVNLIGVFKAPNEVINVILQLFVRGVDILNKVAEMLKGARQELINNKAFDPSA